MGMGLPLLLSDIPVFKEITYSNGLFFDLADPSRFVELVRNILDKQYDLEQFSSTGMMLAKKYYTKTVYLESLFKIYDQLIEGSPARVNQ